MGFAHEGGSGFGKTTVTVKNGEFAEDTETRIESMVKEANILKFSK